MPIVRNFGKRAGERFFARSHWRDRLRRYLLGGVTKTTFSPNLTTRIGVTGGMCRRAVFAQGEGGGAQLMREITRAPR